MLLPSKLPPTPGSSNKSNPLWNVVRKFSPLPAPTCNYRSLKRINQEHELDLTKFRSVKNRLRCQAVFSPLSWLSTAWERQGNCSWETSHSNLRERAQASLSGAVACIHVPPVYMSNIHMHVFLWRLKHTKKKIISYEFSKISKMHIICIITNFYLL